MVSAISTRGVKFKFSEGERILCYEPDPTKTKVLYESKVLDLYVNRDERGRKVPEYLIHFFGWNSSWDRYVREEFILPYTEENCELQSKLATEAALTIKGKRKIKLPPLIKETLAKKQCNEAAKQKTENNESATVASSDSDSSDEEGEKEIIIDIPDLLKTQLVEDNTFITKNNKLIQLPCKPNVICILEDFVRHFARKLLCASPPKNSKNGEQLMSEDVENKLNLCKETMDGLRVCFDFTLPELLLYSQEKSQYQSEAISCSPVSSSYKWESQETIENIPVKIEKPDVEVPLTNLKSNTVEKPEVKLEVDTAIQSRSPGRKSLRSQSALLNPPVKQDNIPNGETEIKLILPEKVKKEEKLKKIASK